MPVKTRSGSKNSTNPKGSTKENNSVNQNDFTNTDKADKEPTLTATNNLTVFHINVDKNILHSNKLDKIMFYCNSLEADIVFIYEPGLNKGEQFPVNNFPDHVFYPVFDLLFVLVKRKQKFTVKSILSVTPAVVVSGRQVTCIGVYNRWSMKNDDGTTKDFNAQDRLNNATEALTKGLSGANKKAIVGGDFNLDVTTEGKSRVHAYGLRFFLKSRGFRIGEFEFTRKGKNGQRDTCPDWIGCRNFPNGVLATDHFESSDHEMVSFTNHKIDLDDNKVVKKFPLWKFGTKAEKMAKSKSPRAIWSDDDLDAKSLEELLALLNEFLQVVDGACRSEAEIMLFGQPWYNDFLKQCKIKIKNCKNAIERRALFKVYKKNVNIAKQAYVRRGNKKKGNPWPKINNPGPSKYVVMKDGEQVEITDNFEMAEAQNLCWKVTIDELVPEIDSTKAEPIIERFKARYDQIKAEAREKATRAARVNANYQQTAEDEEETEKLFQTKWKFRTPTENDIFNIIKNSKPKASSSFDGISHKLVKKCMWHIAPLISRIFTKMIDESEFPASLHPIKLVPVHKAKKPKEECASYRPIAIQCTVAKLFDQWLCKEITRVTDKLEIIPNNIHGYRKNHSCATALRQLFGVFDEARARKVNVAILGLDYSRAYDTVALDLCPRIIGAIGADDKSVDLLSKFLCGRPSKSVQNGVESSPNIAKCGILQGASTSPKLFSIITVDKEAILRKHCDGMVLYADDSLIYWFYERNEGAKNEVIKRIETASAMVENWADQAQLKLNHGKTELICFCGCVRGNCKDNCRVTEVNIVGKVVPAAKVFKFLGVDLNHNGLIDPYVDNLLKKINVANGKLKSMQYGATLEHKRCLFFGLIISQINTAASAVLPRMNNGHIKSLNSKVRSCLRTVSNVPLFREFNFDGSRYSATDQMNNWAIPTVWQLRDQAMDINSREFFDANKFEELKNGVGNLQNYHQNSYVKKEFNAAKSYMEKYNLTTDGFLEVSKADIKSQHAKAQNVLFTGYKNVKKIVNAVRNTIKVFIKAGMNIDESLGVLNSTFKDEMEFHKNEDGLSIGFGFKHNEFVENDDFNSRRF